MDINALYSHLDELFRTQQIDQVEPYLLEQLMVANQELNKDVSLAIVNELIGFYRSQNRFEEALRVANQALSLCASEYILGSISHATTLLNTATTYQLSGQPEKALELFKQAEKIYEEKLSIGDDHFAGLFNNMSAVYADLGDTDKAAEYLLRAAAIMDALPNRVVESAVTHANLAALYFKTKNYYGAKREISTACSLLENRSECAGQYQQFRAMQDMFAAYPD